MVNKGNASRTERLPTRFEDVSADWLTRTLQGQYPGIVVEEMKLVELIAGHTTKARVEVKLNQAGVDAGIPRQLCLKANRSEEHTSELQSLMRISYAVFCLKKKKKKQNNNTRM